MNGAELKTFAESIIDETIESDLFYSLLNTVKLLIEEERDWMKLKVIDDSNTLSTSDTYLTTHALPSDFARPMREINIGTDAFYFPIANEDKYKYRESGSMYYIDHANDVFGIIGNESEEKTIYFRYIKFTPDITSDTEWVFPERFHKILAIKLAAYYTAGIDADDIYARMSPEHKLMAQMLEQAMYKWDEKLALGSFDYSATPPQILNGNRDGAININE